MQRLLFSGGTLRSECSRRSPQKCYAGTINPTQRLALRRYFRPQPNTPRTSGHLSSRRRKRLHSYRSHRPPCRECRRQTLNRCSCGSVQNCKESKASSRPRPSRCNKPHRTLRRECSLSSQCRFSWPSDPEQPPGSLHPQTECCCRYPADNSELPAPCKKPPPCTAGFRRMVL